jgi:DNA polymerase-3 subunit gamma/tau
VAYTVLARKYRSRTFDEVVGQEAVATTLANAIRSGRVHHGYLFSGTRGTGKTSMARILAKSLNCLNASAPSVTPCLTCDACRAIAEGQDIDVVEIDAASNTGVDNIRDLRSNAAYRPARARFKIYIIDEVHMLSTGAFNALLKTLEEPPAHVKFILATTELQKVPATIQSRCQRFHFHNIDADAIAARLAQIVAAEGLPVEPAALRRIARLASGSMRDALSILDQVLSLASEQVSQEVLDELLPPPVDERLLRVLRPAAEGDPSGVLSEADALLSGGRALETFLAGLIDVVRTLMLIRACGPDSCVVDLPRDAVEDWTALAQRFELSQYVQIIAMLEELRRNVRFSGCGRALTDAVLVRIAHLTRWTPIEDLIQATGGEGGRSVSLPEPAVPASSPLPEKKKQPQPEPILSATAASPGGARDTMAGGGTVASRPAEPAISASADASGLRGSVATAPTSPPGSERPPKPTIEGGPSRRGARASSEADPASERGPAVLLSADERDVIMGDAVVRQVMELFQGEVVKLEKRTGGAAADPPAAR